MRSHPASTHIHGSRDLVDLALYSATANVAAANVAAANVAAAIAGELAVSVADAHAGAVIRSLPHDEVVVVTSDPNEITRVAGDRLVRLVRV